MCRIKRLLCQLVIFAFMLSSIPAAAHMCMHDMQGSKAKPAVEKTASDLPPCHQQMAEKSAQKTDMAKSGKMDCCGDKCTCAAGTCNAVTAFLSVKPDTVFTALSAMAYLQTADNFRPFMPEQATPPPRT